MSLTKKTVEDFLDEIKAAVKEYLQKLETSFKQRLKKLLIVTIITAVLLAAAMSFIGTASIFIIIGSLKYFIMFLPAWLAWILMGIISILIGVALLVIVFLIIRSQLKSSGEP
jgi:uncharacterized protein involved in cysteine biosynthesis